MSLSMIIFKIKSKYRIAWFSRRVKSLETNEEIKKLWNQWIKKFHIEVKE
jgi:hypothetical protein